MTTTNEKFSGVGRSKRHLMIKLWKESGTTKSLKQWAKDALVGDVAAVWFATKRGL